MPKHLEQIITSIIASNPQTKVSFDIAKKRACGELKIQQPTTKDLLEAYQKMVKKKRIDKNEMLEHFLIKANIRNLSGIAVITSLIKPYFCPGKCVYCPTEARMPKSYIATEPAAARALRLDFSPYQQMKRRIEMLESNGHKCDKIEFIIKGGTWNAYPIRYQYWFMLESFKACNDFKRRKPVGETSEDDWKERKLHELQDALEIEQTYNESANHRMIGVTLETRPDAIAPKTIQHMRNQGCTRVELGLQAADDKILALIERGHTVQQFRDAILLLRTAGFKVDLHFMPDLPGTTAQHDVDMYKSLFTDEGLRPDMVKIYPCTVIKSAELYQWLLDGRYTPYSEQELFSALLEMKLATPRYCRISRLIRDIPSDQIEAGNKVTNLREELTKELTKRGQRCICLRCREIGRAKQVLSPRRGETERGSSSAVQPTFFVEKYETWGGTEYFLTYETPDRSAVYGFLRLRLPHPACHCEESERTTSQSRRKRHTQRDCDVTSSPDGESTPRNDRNIESLAILLGLSSFSSLSFIRELHIYGSLVGIGEQSKKDSQHKGLGKKLMAEAERISKENGFENIAVISGVGVRGYYRKLGYKKVGTYMVKRLSK